MNHPILKRCKKQILIFIVTFLTISVTSCIKEKIRVGNTPAPISYADSLQGISEQKVTADEINGWFAKNQAFKPGPVFLNQAEQAIINQQHIIKYH